MAAFAQGPLTIALVCEPARPRGSRRSTRSTARAGPSHRSAHPRPGRAPEEPPSSCLRVPERYSRPPCCGRRPTSAGQETAVRIRPGPNRLPRSRIGSDRTGPARVSSRHGDRHQTVPGFRQRAWIGIIQAGPRCNGEGAMEKMQWKRCDKVRRPAGRAASHGRPLPSPGRASRSGCLQDRVPCEVSPDRRLSAWPRGTARRRRP